MVLTNMHFLELWADFTCTCSRPSILCIYGAVTGAEVYTYSVSLANLLLLCSNCAVNSHLCGTEESRLYLSCTGACVAASDWSVYTV